MSHSTQLGFQDATSPSMEELLFFHDHTLMIVILISTFVLYVLTVMVSTGLSDSLVLDSQEVETIWTFLPALTLILIALPSLRILYLMDEVSTPLLTVKAIGHQWYWSYEYTDFHNLAFDSYMIPTSDLTPGQFRLMETDHRMMVPTNTPTRVLVSADDVLHSWAIPALGVKLDAVPGRLNQTALYPSRNGVYYGHCSEICGANHTFMPVVVESIPSKTFNEWAISGLDE